MAQKIWLNGKLVDREDARITVFDHGLLYGDGVFEGIRVYNGRVFELAAHIKRLYESAKAIRLDISIGMTGLADAVTETVSANKITDGYVRLVVTRGVGTLGLDPFICKNNCIFIIADDIQLYPQELYEKGMKVISATTVRNHPLAIPPQAKSLNYLNNILAKRCYRKRWRGLHTWGRSRGIARDYVKCRYQIGREGKHSGGQEESHEIRPVCLR